MVVHDVNKTLAQRHTKIDFSHYKLTNMHSIYNISQLKKKIERNNKFKIKEIYCKEKKCSDCRMEYHDL